MKSKILSAQKEEVVIAVFEGDNEIAIVNTGSNGVEGYALVVCVEEEGEDVCILEEFFGSMQTALKALNEFLEAEYEGV